MASGFRSGARGLILVFAVLLGAEGGETPAESGIPILDGFSFCRMHFTLRTPVVQDGAEFKPRGSGVPWLDQKSSSPPAAWRNPDFDDATWLRGTPGRAFRWPHLARLALRGKFLVTDPAQVRGLVLSVDFHGGAVACLNGKEFARSHLPAGGLKETTLAEPYPLEAFVTAEGDLIAVEGTYTGKGQRTGKPDEDALARIKRRVRMVRNLPIPANLLRPGVNVLALEIVRAPYHQVLLEKEEEVKKRRGNRFDWGTCELTSLRLSAAGTLGLVPVVTRPEGFQVWNGDPMAGDTDLDWGDPCELLRPVRLAGARNGFSTGKVLAGSSKPLKGLRAVPSDLSGPKGVIPASAVRVRYGAPGGVETGLTPFGRINYPAAAGLLGHLVDAPPEEVPVRSLPAPHRGGATRPVWITVKAPKDAKPGLYKGHLAVETAGETPVRAPLELNLADWTIPDSQNFQTWFEAIEVPDTLAVEYDVPLWSERHWQMIGRAFGLIGDTGSRVVYVPAIAHTNIGNAESMIRWIKKGENRFEFDFSIMDKYLDLAQKHLGSPKIVVLQVWEVYMRAAMQKRFEDFKSLGAAQVTQLDPSSGKTEMVLAPKLSDPASKALWQNLLAEVRARLKKRGLEQSLMFGMFTDATPPKEDIEFFQALAPDLPWVHQGHGLFQAKLHGIAEVGYQASVWGGYRFADGLKQTGQEQAPIMECLYGWKRPRLDAVFERNTDLDSYPCSRWRFFPETAITGDLRGIGRVGADYWRAVKDKNGRRRGWMHDRFPEGSWGGAAINLNLCNPVLGPGRDGPEATNRLVALIEGLQESEARIFIERALTEPALKARLGADLAQRGQEVLDDRLASMWKALSNYQLAGENFFGATGWRWTAGVNGHAYYLASDGLGCTERLYALAAEVARKAGVPDGRR